MPKKDGRFSHEDSVKGARESARLRSERAQEKVTEVIEHEDGTVTVVRETYALHLIGARRTLVPLDLVNEYPIVLEFVDEPLEGASAEEPWQVRGSLKDVKHEVLRRAASGTIRGEDGSLKKLVINPGDLGEGSFHVRLAWWTNVLDERLSSQRDEGRRLVCDGVSDVESIVADDDVDDSSCSKAGPGGLAMSGLGQVEGGYGYCELVDAIESVLSEVGDYEAHIFREHFLNDRDYKEIARELGKACSSMTYAMKKVLPLVRERLRELGY